eukprot:TRINITY_DN2639_c0_g2_i1.p1 TRINITY_DN2639_c0_g2~~TRINITY_DN2639_c0_g2_i1.p1  ORF type:complete len:795 (-),score=76.53 TRINITY_DN2639_c0_g2_i1:132-2516(-)
MASAESSSYRSRNCCASATSEMLLRTAFDPVEAWRRLLVATTIIAQASAGPRAVSCLWSFSYRLISSEEKSFAARIDLLTRILRLRACCSSGFWDARTFKLITLRLCNNAQRLTVDAGVSSSADAASAAVAFRECIAIDPGAHLERRSLYPDHFCLVILARCGGLKCDDVGGVDAVAKHVSILLRQQRPRSSAFALMDHFQLDIATLEVDIRNVVLDTFIALANGTHADLRVDLPCLVSLLVRKPSSWWQLSGAQLDQLETSLRHPRNGSAVAAQFAAWRNQSGLTRQETILMLEAQGSGRVAEPARILAALKQYNIGHESLREGQVTALQYVLTLLRKPRTAFPSVVGIAAQFALAEEDSCRLQLEIGFLNALATLVQNDRRAADRVVQQLSAESSLSRLPADWALALTALRKRRGGPTAWPAWQARASAQLEGSRLCLEVDRLLVDDAIALKASVSALLMSDTIGLDAEWLTGSKCAAIIQFATATKVHIWDLQLLGHADVSDALATVLQADVLKLGFGFQQCDWPQLSPWVCEMTNLLDLDKLWFRLRPSQPLPGLKGLVANILKRRLDKTEQCSDWSARPLTESQLDYAALDAHCLLQVWEAVKLSIADIDMQTLTCDLRRSNQSEQASASDRWRHLETLLLRVGCVTKVRPMGGTRHLWICDVNLGPVGQRQSVQGAQVVEGQLVIVMCNVRSREFCGIESQLVFLIAHYPDGSRRVAQPPPCTAVGTPLSAVVPTLSPIDLTAPDNAWNLSRDHFATGDNGEVLFSSQPLLINGMPCVVDGGSGAKFR